MKSWRFLNLLVFLVLIAAYLVAPVAAESPEAPAAAPTFDLDKVEPQLLEALQLEGQADFVVVFAEQADLSPAYEMGWDERGWFVYDTLTEVANRSQTQAKAYLDSQGLAYHTFIAGNELYVWAGDLTAVSALANLPEVALVRSLGTYYFDPIVDETVSNVPEGPDALAWGITETHADDFWATFGLQGDGIVVASIDSGVQWDHPALDQAYKCPGDPGSNVCWEDPDNTCPSGLPCDPLGHGTHTMGTMIGDDDPSLTWQAGMAPDALWITCNAGAPSAYALNTCADWLLAPNGNPANRPHVVNNSWGGGGCDSWYLAKVQAWRAAGIFPAFSAGNSSGCNSLGSPGDYQESFASTGHNSSRVHSYAQGPSCYGHEPYTKPNLSAPAVAVCSSVPGNSWSCAYSGTSMASPHSAGAVALLWSCNPSLIGQMNPTFEALQNGADPPDPPNPPCGAPPDGEGTYEDGYGYLNIYQTGLLYCGVVQVGYLEGYVNDQASGDPIEGADVNASPAPLGNQILATTDPTGYYTMTLLVGTYDVTASKNGYTPQTIYGVVVNTDTVTTRDFELEFLGQWMPGPSNAPFEYNRFDGVFDPVDGLIYFPGGRSGAAAHDRSIYTYDPLNDVWANTTCDMMHNAANVTAVLIEDDGTGRGEAIYLFGGYDVAAAANIAAVQRYYPSEAGCVVETVATDPYPDLAPNNLPVGAGGVAEVGGKAYVFGGWDSALPYFSNRTWEYDPLAAAGSRWTELAATLTPARAYIQVAVQGGKVYAMGGTYQYDAGPPVDLIPTNISEVFDPANPGAGWTAITNMPVASAEGRGFGFDSDTLSVAQVEGKLYVAGGGDWPDVSAEVMEYDVATDTWDQTFPDLIAARRNHAGVFVPLCTDVLTDGLPGMWVFGGRTTSDDPPFGNPEYFPLPCRVDQPELSLFKDVSAPLVMAGDQVTYTLTYSNAGDGQAPGTLISDALPAEVLYVSSDPAGAYYPISHTVVWMMDIMTGPISGTLNLVVEVIGTTPPDTIVFNDAYLSWEDQSASARAIFQTIGPPDAAFVASVYSGCQPLDVQFTDTSLYSPTQWLWSFGDSATSTETNPLHTYDDYGDFVVTLWVSNTYGGDWATDTVNVYQTPMADFSWTPSTIYTDTMVYFSDTSVGQVSEWWWDFDDGYNADTQNPTHTYANTGTFTVTLVVTSDMGCSGMAEHTLTVHPQEYLPPILYITKTVEPLHQYPGEPVTYTIVFGNVGGDDALGVTVSDTLPAEVEYAGSNPEGVYDAVAHELVWAGLDLGAGDMVEASVWVTIAADVQPSTWMTNSVYLFYSDWQPLVSQVSHHAQPPCIEITGVSLTLETSGTLYVNDLIEFNADIAPDDAAKPYNYTIAYDDGDTDAGSSSADPLAFDHTYTAPGTYTVEFEAWNCDMIDPVVATLEVVVMQVVTPCVEITDVSLTLETSGTLYVNDLIEFSADLTPDDAAKPYTYTIDYGDGDTDAGSSSADPLAFDHTYTAPGTYTVEFEAWNCDMIDPVVATLEVVVMQAVTPCVEIDTIDLGLLTGGTFYTNTLLYFNANLSPNDATKPYTYTIDYGDGNTVGPASSSTDPFTFTYTYAATGTFTVEFAAWNCDMTVPITDTVQLTVEAIGPEGYTIFLPIIIK